ncbi:MAG TPA: winged helix-turn-helix domain-containing protein [Pyrinomonadaceae bacterium]|nr:winged helix-turn-helix domain-containing protein [Pyrinomonadaceae bacterium]
MDGVNAGEYRFGEFTLDEARRRISRNGETLSLNPKAFDLLVELIRSSGSVITKDDLLARVWPDQFVEENNLSVQVSALRKLLGNGNGAQYIATVPGKGYSFVAPVESNHDFIIEQRTYERITIEQDDANAGLRQLSPPTPRRNFLLKLLFVCVLVAIAFTAAMFWRQFSKANAFEPSSFSERKLTTSGRVNIAALSPDGKMFAYSVIDVPREHSSIRVGQTNGSSDVEVVPAGAEQFELVSFSSDGQFVYYVEHGLRQSENGTLIKVPALGGVSQRVLSGINIYPAISPDEKKLAVVRTDSKNKTSTLALINLDGSNEQALVTRPLETPIRALSLAWSKDASLIAFCSRRENEDTSEVFVADTAAGNVQQLTDSKIGKIFRLGWLADRTGLIAITSSVNRAWGALWHINYPDGTLSEITRDHRQYASALSLSQDARSAVAVEVSSESNIWTSLSPSADLTQLTFGGLSRQDGWFGLDISNDGRFLYTAKTGANVAIWLMDADGRDTRQLTPADALDFNPTFSADGEFVVFDSNRSGSSEIWRVRTNGKDIEQLTFDGENTNPSFLPNGETIVYKHGDANGTSLQRLSLNEKVVSILDPKGCTSPRISPNGEFVACGRRIGGQPSVVVISASTGEQLKQFPVPQTFNFDLGGIRWTPDGRFICYRDWTYGLWRQPVDGGQPQRIENLPEEKIYQYVWSRDGKRLVLTRGREMRDVVLLNRS